MKRDTSLLSSASKALPKQFGVMSSATPKACGHTVEATSQPTFLWGERVGPLPRGRAVSRHGPDPCVVALGRTQGIVREVAGVPRDLHAIWDGCPGDVCAVAAGRRARGESSVGRCQGLTCHLCWCQVQGRIEPLCFPSLYSHSVLHLVVDVAGEVVSRLPAQQVMHCLRSKAHLRGPGQLLSCGTGGER